MTRSIRGRAPRAGALLVAAVILTVPGPARSQTRAREQVEAQVINFRDAEWGPPGTAPRFPAGVQTAQLGVDPDN